MKLQSKERIGGKVKRRYEVAKTPYQRLIESNQIPEEVGEELKGRYLSLNPTELKRDIDAKLAELYQAYEEEKRAQHVDSRKKSAPGMVRHSWLNKLLLAYAPERFDTQAKGRFQLFARLSTEPGQHRFSGGSDRFGPPVLVAQDTPD
jgi:hypothetical protein